MASTAQSLAVTIPPGVKFIAGSTRLAASDAADRVVRFLVDKPLAILGILDSQSSKRALDLLEALREHHGMTVLVVSHDSAVAARADRVVHLVDGRVI